MVCGLQGTCASYISGKTRPSGVSSPVQNPWPPQRSLEVLECAVLCGSETKPSKNPSWEAFVDSALASAGTWRLCCVVCGLGGGRVERERSRGFMGLGGCEI